ncbi:sulfatase-like hydrolase/transferase [Escherichia coli]
MNQQRTQSAREYDTNVLKPFQDVPNDPAPKKLIIVHLLGTHIKYKYRYPENQGKFDGNTDQCSARIKRRVESYNDYDNANLYNDHVVASLIKDFKAADPNGFLLYFLTTVKRFTTRRLQNSGRNEDNPTRHMYTIPFLLWTSEKWQATHPHLTGCRS